MDNTVNEKKCYNCGKTFHTPTDLERHRKRKTPCLIRDLKEEDRKNPLRCIYCNKIFSTDGNLVKHLKICKIKNGGLDKLHDKVKHEEQMRIMQEEHKQELKAMEAKMQEQMAKQAEQLSVLTAEIKKIKAQQEITPVSMNTNNGIVVGELNITNTTNVNIHINSYTNPSADHLLTFEKFNEIFLKEFAGLPVSLVCGLYFDKSRPENMSIHLINKSTGEMLAMIEGNWATKHIDEVSQRMRLVGYEIAERGIKMHRKKLTFGDADYVCGNILQNVHHPGTEERDLREIREKIVESREITGAAPHIAAKLESTRAVGRVRKGINVVQIQPVTHAPDRDNNGERGDNIADL